VPDLCQQVVEADGSTGYWAISTNAILLNDPKVEDLLSNNTVWVQSCGSTVDADATFWLHSKAGSVRLNAYVDINGERQPRWHFYTFPPGSATGAYLLEIEDARRKFSRQLYVMDYLEQMYEGVQFRISDPKTGKVLNLISPGQTVRIDYKGKPDTAVKVGFYQTETPGGDMFALADAWQFTTDQNGAYSQLLPVPETLKCQPIRSIFATCWWRIMFKRRTLVHLCWTAIPRLSARRLNLYTTRRSALD
jgi:hypothetical protein